MRITFNTLNRHMLHVINNRYADLAKLQDQLSTGKRLLRPSDDPVSVANDLKLRSKGTELTQYNKNQNDGMSFMSVSDTAMQSMNTLMQRVRELAVQASNDTLSADERAFIQKEVEQLTRQVLGLANTNYKGDFVFAGTQTKIAPFPTLVSRANTALDYTNLSMAYYDAAGQLRNGFDNTPITNILPGSFTLERAGVTYREGIDFTLDYVNGVITTINPAIDPVAFPSAPGGPNYALGGYTITFDYVGKGKDVYGDPVSNRGEILREIETGITMPINIQGDELLTDAVTGMNTIEVLIKFGQDLLQNNRAAAETAITDIDVVYKNMMSAQSRNGARMNRFEVTQGRNELQQTETTRLQSETEDAEFAETASRFSLVQNVYNAALKSAAQIIQPSLANFL